MAIDFKSSINLGGNQLQNAAIHPTNTAPANPVEGQIYFNTTAGNKKLYVYDSGAWLDVTGDIRSISAGTGISVSNGSGGDATVSLSHLGIQSLTDPNADRILFWDDSAGVTAWLTASAATGISISGTSLQLGSIPNSSLTNSSVTYTAGNGLTGGGAVSLGGSTTINVGAGTGITVNADDIALKNAGNLTQYTLLMWGAGQLEQPDIVRTVDQSNNETITFGGSVVIDNNLTVNGTITTINTETIALADNIIELNSNLDSGTAPTQNAGIEINRGSSANVSFYWDEANDRWHVGGKLKVETVNTQTGAGLTSDILILDPGNTGEIESINISDVGTILGVANYSVLLDSVNRANVTKSGNTYTVTHGLGSKLVQIQVVDATSYETVFVETARPTTNTATVAFGQTVTEATYIFMATLIGNLDTATAGA